MINETSTDRIIGDFLELNASMIEKREKSKLPKFIAKFIWKKDIEKLLKQVETLRNSNYILNMHNISELSFYIFNNFDEKNYKAIYLVKIDKILTYDTTETIVKFDNVIAIFDFDSNNDSFNVKIREKDELDQNINYNLTLHRLYNEASNDILSRINDALKNTLCDYIKEIISLYE